MRHGIDVRGQLRQLVHNRYGIDVRGQLRQLVHNRLRVEEERKFAPMFMVRARSCVGASVHAPVGAAQHTRVHIQLHAFTLVYTYSRMP